MFDALAQKQPIAPRDQRIAAGDSAVASRLDVGSGGCCSLRAHVIESRGHDRPSGNSGVVVPVRVDRVAGLMQRVQREAIHGNEDRTGSARLGADIGALACLRPGKRFCCRSECCRSSRFSRVDPWGCQCLGRGQACRWAWISTGIQIRPPSWSASSRLYASFRSLGSPVRCPCGRR